MELVKGDVLTVKFANDVGQDKYRLFEVSPA